MAVRLPRCLLGKDEVLLPARWVAEGRFVVYLSVITTWEMRLIVSPAVVNVVKKVTFKAD
jgi:hypothetical protein